MTKAPAPLLTVLSMAFLLWILGNGTVCGQGLAVWNDLAELAVVEAPYESFLGSSVCLDGCAFDRHAPSDWRYLRKKGPAGIILEEKGPGVITRLWFTMGDGKSQPLDPAIRLRVELDGRKVVESSLSSIFGEEALGWGGPLVLDRTLSSGGNLSLVPWVFERQARISLLGADQTKIWFQIGGFRFNRPLDPAELAGAAKGLANLLNAHEKDPWSQAGGVGGTRLQRAATLLPGETQRFIFSGPDLFSHFSIETEADNLNRLLLRWTFDDWETIAVQGDEFFGLPPEKSTADRRLLLRSEGTLHRSFLPMPFWKKAKLEVVNTGETDLPLKVSFRRKGEPPREGSGYLTLQLFNREEVATQPLLWVDLLGRGRWVGLWTRLGAPGRRMEYLEGDEAIWVDRVPEGQADLLGTGTEDFFSGGFYFDGGDFSQPLHGSPWHRRHRRGTSTVAYRWMLLDSVFFRKSLWVQLENGRTGELAMAGKSVAYLYWLPE